METRQSRAAERPRRQSASAAGLLSGLALLAVLLCTYWLLVNRLIWPVPYGYDEADYMQAAGSGLVANWTDTPTMGFGEFVSLGSGAGRESSRNTGLSSKVRAQRDVLFERHWHGPLYYFALSAAARLDSGEQATRRAMAVIPAITLILICAGLQWARPGLEGRIAALLFGVLYAFSYSSIRTASMLMPHSLFVLFCLAALVFLAKFRETGNLRHWHGAVICAALALATLEIGILLLAILVAFCWSERRGVFAGWKRREWGGFVTASALVYVAALTAVWPAAIARLSLVTAWAFMAYLAVFRGSAWGENTTLLDSWIQRLTWTPVEWLVLLAAVIVYFARRGKPRTAAPALWLGALMLISVLRVVSTDYRYMTVYLPALLLFSAIVLADVLARMSRPRQVIALVAICGAVAWNSLAQFHPWGPQEIKQSWATIEFVRTRGLESARLLVPQGYVPQMRYYFPRAAIRGYVSANEARALGRSGGFDGILTIAPSPRYDPL